MVFASTVVHIRGPKLALDSITEVFPAGMEADLFHEGSVFEKYGLYNKDVMAPSTAEIAGHAAPGFTPTDLAALNDLSAVALGQSLGGGVTVLVDELRPGLLRRVLLCEPVAFAPDAMASRPLGEGPGDGGNFMSQIARKRRAVWPDRDAVLASYRSRSPFDVLAPDLSRIGLKWTPVLHPEDPLAPRRSSSSP